MSTEVGAIQTAFFAYPSQPQFMSDAIESAVKKHQLQSSNEIRTWKEMEISGAFIRNEVISGIEQADVLIADISQLNFNVTYEIGFAIGRGKKIFLVKNPAVKEIHPNIREVGIFDTLGYVEYQNSDELVSIINDAFDGKPIEVTRKQNLQAPVYLLDCKFKTDYATLIASRLKKARYTYRTFDPNESPRLSAYEAIEQVAQSYGVLIPLLGSMIDDNRIHNLRAAFIAGLGHGLNKVVHILQQAAEDPIPLDYRDLVQICTHPDDIKEIVGEFAADVAEAIQKSDDGPGLANETLLQQISLGATSAENEIKSLDSYYLPTDEFLRAKRGEAHLVVGRKGSGKSA